MAELLLGEIKAQVTKKNIKNLYLRVHPLSGNVRISAPFKMKQATILGFAHSKLRWIEKQQAKFKRRAGAMPGIYLNDAACQAKLNASLPGLIKKWEAAMAVKVRKFGIKKMKTRWGSCNPRAKRIWFNLELAKKSAECLEYVVVHELAHLIEGSHNAKFKAVMDRFLPNWRHQRSVLNESYSAHSL